MLGRKGVVLALVVLLVLQVGGRAGQTVMFVYLIYSSN